MLGYAPCGAYWVPGVRGCGAAAAVAVFGLFGRRLTPEECPAAKTRPTLLEKGAVGSALVQKERFFLGWVPGVRVGSFWPVGFSCLFGAGELSCLKDPGG